MDRTTRMQLKRTHGRTGQPIMPAIEDPADPETVDTDSLLDMVSPAVDGERSSLHLALLDAMARATTWRV